MSPDNHGPLVNVAMWMALAPTIIITLVKLYTKWESIKTLQQDDWLMIFSMIVAVAQTVATSSEVHYGLGQNQDSLTERQIDSFSLCEYVAQILYVVTIFSTKLVGLQFYFLLARSRIQKSVVKFSMYFILLWIVVAIFIVSFQCHPPRPWLMHSRGCIHKNAFWCVNTIVDISTQLVVGLLPVFLLKSLHTSISKKIFSMAAFTPNLLTIPLSIIRLKYVFDSSLSQNYTWDSQSLAIVTALNAILSVLITGIPFLKPIFDSISMAPLIITDETRGYILGSIDERRPKVSAGLKLRSHENSVMDSMKLWSGSQVTGTVLSISDGQDQE